MINRIKKTKKKKKKEEIKLVLISDEVVDVPKISRVEVIDKSGRAYVALEKADHIQLSLQDDGRTLKIFIS